MKISPFSGVVLKPSFRAKEDLVSEPKSLELCGGIHPWKLPVGYSVTNPTQVVNRITNGKVLSESAFEHLSNNYAKMVINELYHNNTIYEKSSGYFTMTITNLETSESSIGLICNLDLGEIRAYDSVWGHEGVLQSRVREKFDHLNMCNRAVSPIFLVNDDKTYGSLTDLLKEDFKYTRIFVLSVTVGDYEYVVEEVIKPKPIVEFVESLPKLWIADGHHRFNAQYQNPKFSKLFCMITDLSSTEVNGYNRNIITTKDIGDYTDLYKYFSVCESSDESKEVPVIHSKDTYYKLNLSLEDIEKLGFPTYYDFMDKFLLPDIETSLHLESKFTYGDPLTMNLAGGSWSPESIHVLMPPLDKKYIASPDNKKTPAKSTNFGMKPINMVFIPDNQ